ncbi:hypothetical protein HUN08_12365 [Gordonia sp. X0973]|uniref:hypothetical protein n=1 Tax=Gordonia sp. X0973 TaxID=2742602 RepID=UPI000F54904F|nr:hypothetical protein [Gordonia sp. X0973]QKT07889.1 hypothetical protein HUN08_12365 [Gordonia sp. X0973]
MTYQENTVHEFIDWADDVMTVDIYEQVDGTKSATVISQNLTGTTSVCLDEKDLRDLYNILDKELYYQ